MDYNNYKFNELNLNNVLRMIRREKGMTQQQVADILDVDRSTYSYYETGKTELDIKTTLALCEIFEIKLDEFLNQDKAIAESQLVTDEKQYQNQIREMEIPISEYERQLLKLANQMDNWQRSQVMIKAQDIIDKNKN